MMAVANQMLQTHIILLSFDPTVALRAQAKATKHMQTDKRQTDKKTYLVILIA